MNKKIYTILIGTVILIIIAGLLINKTKEEKVNVSDVTIQGNSATGTVNIEEIEIKDITRIYESGITTIRAKMYNQAKNEKNVTVKIILKDEQGNELTNMVQVIENLYPNTEKVLSTGIAGDYSKANEIKFEIIK